MNCIELYCIGMNATNRLETFLRDLAKSAVPGDQLPPVRALMSRFGVSQSIVQRVTAMLKEEGKISAEVGRGTFFTGGESGVLQQAETRPRTAPASRTTLMLRRSAGIMRGRRVLEDLQQRLIADGHRVVEVSYTDAADADLVLRGLPRFDACMIQSSFETISIPTLAAVRRKTDVIVVDGAALAGTEVDAVGLEWGRPVEQAVKLLRERGHERIALVMTGHFLLATELGKMRFADLIQEAGTGKEPTLIEVMAWPHEDYERLAVERLLAARRSDDRLPFTALIVWGVESGARFRSLLAENGVSVPNDLSVVLLGRPDLHNEHDGFFTTIGARIADQVAGLYGTITRRWMQPDRPFGTLFVEVRLRKGSSVGSPTRAKASM
jgi:DNA-binding LacI/PurR family transcriptional regulator